MMKKWVSVKTRGDCVVDFPFQVLSESLCFHPCNTSMLCCWNVDGEKGEGEELSHPVLLPQTPAFPWIFQLSTEEQHYLKDILLKGIKVMVVELSWTDPFPPSPPYFESWEHQSRLIQASKGLCKQGRQAYTRATKYPQSLCYL